MNSSNLIIRSSVEQTPIKIEYHNPSIKIEYHNPLDSGRVVSQTFLHPSGQPPTKVRKISCNVGSSFPQIAIKKEENFESDNGMEVVLVNGCWDTSNKIPNIIAEMHNVNTEDFTHNSFFKHDLNDSRDLINPSPRGSDSGIESDCTDGNLSWLLNYKIHELPPVPDALNSENNVQNSHVVEVAPMKPSFQPLIVQVPRITEKSVPLKEDGRGVGQSYRYSGPKKPPFTYTELIEYALSEKGELTVSGIYQWISFIKNTKISERKTAAGPPFWQEIKGRGSNLELHRESHGLAALFGAGGANERDHFPFYKQNDDRWKNSVRHNLSINPHFRKGGKAVQGAGHLWTIAQRDDKKSWQIKQRMNQFIQSTYKDTRTQEQEAFDKELQAATESILGEIDSHNKNDSETVSRRGSNIEVEYINLAEGPNGLEDFLSPPVSKQEIVNECGLGSDFFITDINPNALGLNLTEAEAITEDGIYEDMTFEYYELKE